MSWLIFNVNWIWVIFGQMQKEEGPYLLNIGEN